MTSIILVNYQSEDLIRNSLKSFCSFHEVNDVEFIIVNNGGDLEGLINDKSLSSISINFVDSGGNIGFSRANNLGMRYAKGEFILFLNADTLFIEPVLPVLLEKFQQNSSVGVISCRLLNSDLSLQWSYHRGDQIFKKLWRRNPIAIKFFKATQKLHQDQSELQKVHQTIHNTPWVSGAFMMLRKSDINRNNWYWDEDFFMYWEDVELCYRIRKQGFSILYDPTVQLIHIGGGGEANFSAKRFNMMESSKLTFIRKSYGDFIYQLYLFLIKCELRIEKWLVNRSEAIVENSFLKQELDFYLKQDD